MADRKVFLKVKLKSLAEEARIIKAEEQRRKVQRHRGKGSMANVAASVCDSDIREMKAEDRIDRAADTARRAARRGKPWYPMSAQELHELSRHRIEVVRVEARLSGIAYAIIRGRELRRVDCLAGITGKHWERVQAMLKKFGDPDDPVTKAAISLRTDDIAEFCKAQPVKQAA